MVESVLVGTDQLEFVLGVSLVILLQKGLDVLDILLFILGFIEPSYVVLQRLFGLLFICLRPDPQRRVHSLLFCLLHLFGFLLIPASLSLLLDLACSFLGLLEVLFPFLEGDERPLLPGLLGGVLLVQKRHKFSFI